MGARGKDYDDVLQEWPKTIKSEIGCAIIFYFAQRFLSILRRTSTEREPVVYPPLYQVGVVQRTDFDVGHCHWSRSTRTLCENSISWVAIRSTLDSMLCLGGFETRDPMILRFV
jgi:hypothetical protein